MKTIIKVSCVDQALKIVEEPLIASGGKHENFIEFTFCEKWNGMAKKAVFYNNPKKVESYYADIDDANMCEVPHEVTANSGTMYFGVFGVFGDVTRTSEIETVRVKLGAVTTELVPSEPSLGIWEQLLSDYSEIKAEVSQLAEEINDLKNNGVPGGSGEADQARTLWEILQKTAFTQQLTEEELTSFKMAWGIESSGEAPDEPVEPDNPEKTLSSISASYNGGEVAVGTALTSLTGITVKATYSDGSTANVTGYTLSGTIAEGSNTITVSYGGKTTTFTVTGVAESSGEEEGGTEWEDGVAYTDFDWEDGYFINGTGAAQSFNNLSISDYMPCSGASTITFVKTSGGNINYSAFYTSDKAMISGSQFVVKGGGITEIVVPDGAVYFRFSVNTDDKASYTVTPHA